MPQPAAGARPTWRRRFKQIVGLHLRQLPCLHAAVEALPQTLRCWRRRRYQTLDQDEDGDGAEVEDQRQAINKTFGAIMVRISMLAMVGITVMLVLRNSAASEQDKLWPGATQADFDREEFKRDAPVVLYIGALELLVCGACAQTASSMYTRRKHALRHPRDSPERERGRYIKVQLEKVPGMGDKQLYGLGFRPSSDGLECLLVEDVRRGSLLHNWNLKGMNPSAEGLLTAALGAESPEVQGDENVADTESPPGLDNAGAVPPPRVERVHPGAAVVAVNHVSADVGMMQAELTKPQVTLWVRSEVYHPSQLESEVLAEPDAVIVRSNPSPDPTALAEAPIAIALGRPEDTLDGAAAEPELNAGPRCACVAFEDEEPQILMRWLVCSVLFGWVTILPVLFMQPHEERPRQQLFRQYLLKPCVFIIPIWILAWLLDCVEVLLEVKIIHPFYYFTFVHMVLPAVLVWYLMQLQLADERLVIDQRRARQAELAKDSLKSPPVIIEDSAPTLLKEFIGVNPVALVWLGFAASIPIVACSLLTPMTTARARLAQGYLHLVYGLMIPLQLAFTYFVYHVRFIDLPKFYLAGVGLLLSVPCFLVWCFCLMCASRYGRQDMQLVEKQRVERAREVAQKAHPQFDAEGCVVAANEIPVAELVDLSEAIHREWEFIYTA